MGIEYIIIATDNSVTKDVVLKAFSPYCTKIDDEEYLLDYGDIIYEDRVVQSYCRLSLQFNEENKHVISGIIISKPTGDIALAKAIFLLIHEYPMFFICTDFVPMMTANQKCMDLLEVDDIETFEEITLVSSFDEFLALL